MSNNNFQTHDIVLAATLRTFGFYLIEITFSNRDKNRGHFIFENTPELQEFAHEFLLGHKLVEPIVFYNEVRSLSGLVRRTYNNVSS